MTKISTDYRSLLRASDGRDIMQQTMKFFSLVLVLAALGMWLVPGAADDGAEALVRLVISLLFLGIGISLWGVGRPRFDEEFHLDVDNLRLTHVLRGRDGIARLQEQIALDLLELDDGVLLARQAKSRKILSLPVAEGLDAGAVQLLSGMRKRTLA